MKNLITKDWVQELVTFNDYPVETITDADVYEINKLLATDGEYLNHVKLKRKFCADTMPDYITEVLQDCECEAIEYYYNINNKAQA